MECFLSSNKYIRKSEFPLLEPEYPVLKKIVPPMQHACRQLIELARQQNYGRVIIFGSSTTWDFRNDSDLDICIDSEDPSEEVARQITEILSPQTIEFDLVCWKTISSDLLKSEIEKGVIIYEQSADTSRT